MKANILLLKRSRVIPVFFAADDGYVPYLSVSLKSLIDNTTGKYRYKIHILHTDISAAHQAQLKRMETPNCRLVFVDVSEEMAKIAKKNIH